MIKRKEFVTFLKYIGITNEVLQAKIYKYYQKCYNKRYRRSKFEEYLRLIDCESEETSMYVTSYDYRKKINKEINLYSGYGVWGKELRNEIIL